MMTDTYNRAHTSFGKSTCDRWRHQPASESLLSEVLELLLVVPLWSFPLLDDELLPSLKDQGQTEGDSVTLAVRQMGKKKYISGHW